MRKERGEREREWEGERELCVCMYTKSTADSCWAGRVTSAGISLVTSVTQGSGKKTGV